MRNATTAGALLALAANGASAYGVEFHNRTGGTLCAAATRDEPDPFDENVARITEGWHCVDDLGTLHIEKGNGFLDVAIKRADGSDYVADSNALNLPRTTSYVPKDDATIVFALEILKHSAGWAAYSWKTGSDDRWSSYGTVHTVEELPARLDSIGFKPFEAWQLGEKQAGYRYTLKEVSQSSREPRPLP